MIRRVVAIDAINPWLRSGASEGAAKFTIASAWRLGKCGLRQMKVGGYEVS